MARHSFTTFSAAWVALILLSASRAVADIPAPLLSKPRNHTVANPVLDTNTPRGILALFERQSGCYSPNRYCSYYDICCPAGYYGCCADGCTPSSNDVCCYSGGHCEVGDDCCEDGCIPAGTQCCRDGGYCPDPFECVIYDGVLGCCTDLTCSVYLSNGITKTAATAAPTTYRSYTLTDTYTSYSTQRTSRSYTVGAYTTYTTYLYWYYWYYFYTIEYFPSTYTTRTSTTEYRTTTVTCTATDEYDAYNIFLSYSSDLPTPTDAEVSIPLTPTSGALVIGSCSSTRTITSTASDGNTVESTTSYCETSTANGRGATATRTSSSPGSTGLGSASAGHAETISWFFFITVPLVVGTAMILL